MSPENGLVSPKSQVTLLCLVCVCACVCQCPCFFCVRADELRGLRWPPWPGAYLPTRNQSTPSRRRNRDWLDRKSTGKWPASSISARSSAELTTWLKRINPKVPSKGPEARDRGYQANLLLTSDCLEVSTKETNQSCTAYRSYTAPCSAPTQRVAA